MKNAVRRGGIAENPVGRRTGGRRKLGHEKRMSTLVAPTPEAGSKPAQILAAAGTLFLEHGYGAVSMDMVAKTANVSKATLYAHFGSKEELFRAMVAVECQSHTLVSACEEARREEVADGLRRIGRHLMTLVLSPKALAGYRVVVGEAHRFPELAHAFYEAGPARTLEHIAGFLADADARGRLSVPDPQLVAGQFVGLIKSHVHLRFLLCLSDQPAEPEKERIVEAAVAMIVTCYAPGAPQSRP